MNPDPEVPSSRAQMLCRSVEPLGRRVCTSTLLRPAR